VTVLVMIFLSMTVAGSGITGMLLYMMIFLSMTVAGSGITGMLLYMMIFLSMTVAGGKCSCRIRCGYGINISESAVYDDYLFLLKGGQRLLIDVSGKDYSNTFFFKTNGQFFQFMAKILEIR
jgi:hypothetical protein